MNFILDEYIMFRPSVGTSTTSSAANWTYSSTGTNNATGNTYRIDYLEAYRGSSRRNVKGSSFIQRAEDALKKISPFDDKQIHDLFYGERE